MPDLSDFRLGADVLDSAGHKAGTLISVIVDQNGFDPRALVVKDEVSLARRLLAGEKLFTTDEVVIPITAVESASHEVVKLSMAGPDIRRQPLYLSYRREPLTPEEAVVEEGELLTGGLGLPKADEIANKPDGEIEIDGGENVMLGTTGRRLGTVRAANLRYRSRGRPRALRPPGRVRGRAAQAVCGSAAQLAIQDRFPALPSLLSSFAPPRAGPCTL